MAAAEGKTNATRAASKTVNDCAENMTTVASPQTRVATAPTSTGPRTERRPRQSSSQPTLGVPISAPTRIGMPMSAPA